jgi:3-isopropylmalate/(R)-2-methylmalate dehydratase small subunit
MKFTGKVWKFGDDIDTDQIIASQYLVIPDKRKMAQYAMETQHPEFATLVEPGDIIVGGRNFGCGSSRQQAPEVLKELGIKVIVAESFARIFFRNSINLGILLIELEDTSGFSTGDRISIREESLVNETADRRYSFQPLSDFLKQIIEHGGLVNKIKADNETQRKSNHVGLNENSEGNVAYGSPCSC